MKYSIYKDVVVYWTDPDDELMSGNFRVLSGYMGDDDMGVVALCNIDTGEGYTEAYAHELTIDKWADDDSVSE